MTDTASQATGTRPELMSLDSAARERVFAQIAATGGHCEACGATDFEVGDALYLGFLFLDEDSDAYMVALTCRNPQCPKPRTAIRLHDREFLNDAAGASDASRHDGVY